MASGLDVGLLGTGGAIRGLVLAAFGLSTEVFIAASAIIDLGIALSRSIVYYFNGYVHGHDLYLLFILFFVSFIGTLIVKKILSYLSGSTFKVLVLFLVLLTGVVTLLKALYQSH